MRIHHRHAMAGTTGRSAAPTGGWAAQGVTGVSTGTVAPGQAVVIYRDERVGGGEPF